jgi:RNA polymerase sigma factor (sigma-70 family)
MSPLALSLRFLQAQPDVRLVALARDGHEPAFEALVRRYRKELLAYCRRLQPHSGGAEDALQQTLLQAWRALSAGAEVRDVRPWLYRIAHNVSLNSLRVRVAVPHEIPDAEGGAEVEEVVQQRLQARAALAGMASLPDVQRQVFISATLDGASHEEVASALGLSSGAVRGLIYRARATLRAAAAAFTPSPVVHWAIRRAETRPTTPGIVEALAGGGGAGVVGAIAKGGAVLTLAGAFAGAGGAILAPTPAHRGHHHAPMRPARSPAPALSANRAAGVRLGEVASASRARFRARDMRHAGTPGPGGPSTSAARRGHERTTGHPDRGGEGRGSGDGSSPGGSDGGSSGGPVGSSDGGSRATIASSDGGAGSGSPGGSSNTSGGSDGGSSGSSSSGTSGSDGGTSGGGGGPSSGSQTTTTQTALDGVSGPDGGSSGSSTSAGSGGPTATTSSR